MRRLIGIAFLFSSLLSAQQSQTISASFPVSSAVSAAAPTFTPQGASYAGIPQINLTTATSACSGYIAYNLTGAQSGGNLTGVTIGVQVGISATTIIYAQVQSCPGYSNSSISTSPQYVVLGLASVAGSTSYVPTNTALCSQITTPTHSAGYTMVATAVYTQQTSTLGNVRTAIYAAGTGTQNRVVDGSSYSIAFGATAQWETLTYSGSLAGSTSYSICILTNQSMNIWYQSGGASVVSGITYGAWPSSAVFTSNGSSTVSHYLVVTAN